MRNIYHQSAGNPIQPNRLPLTSSSIKLFAERWRANSWHTPVWMLSYGAISLLLLVYMKASGITLLEKLIAIERKAIASPWRLRPL